MQYQNSKTRFSRALTLVEMVIAMAIMAIIFAVLVPQFRAMLNSWDSKASAAETLQNSRVLIDHLNRNLSKAVQITAVSDSAQTNGYIEFEDNDANNMRYDINADNYVEFGPVGNLADLAGPVSQLQFTCYDACDLDTPITNVADIRSVKVQATLTNPGPGKDLTLTTQAYLRTNLEEGVGLAIYKKTPFEFDTQLGQAPALAKIDDEHYLCVYEGFGNDAMAVVLTVDTTNWTITKETPLEFDNKGGATPALSQIDGTHYLCAYKGFRADGYAVVLTVDTGNWTISEETPFEFDTQDGRTPALCEIDNEHYLCVYEGEAVDGWAVVLTVNTTNWTIGAETPFEFDNQKGTRPALSKIDDMYYLCTYAGKWDAAWSVVLKVASSYSITAETPLEFDILKGATSALSKIDDDHYLCAYQGGGDDGWAVTLSVNPSSHVISKGTPFEFDVTKGIAPALCEIDDSVIPDTSNYDYYLCAYQGDSDKGWAEVLVVNETTWSISKDAEPYEFDSVKGQYPALVEIDRTHFLCAYQGGGDDGWAIVLELGETIRP